MCFMKKKEEGMWYQEEEGQTEGGMWVLKEKGIGKMCFRKRNSEDVF